jgi:osmotically-inducible protein OsmY
MGVLVHAKAARTAALVLVALYGVVACATSPHRTAAERAADADTADRVRATLLSDPNIFARHIDIDVDRGVVYLGGYVWENEDFQTARRDAASVAGVKSVVSDMQLDRGGIAGTGR